MKTEEEKLKKRLKINNFFIVILLLVLLAILCVVLVKIFSVQSGLNNNDSNMGIAVQNDDLTFYYDYNKGLVKKSKDKNESLLTENQAFSINYLNGNIYYTTPNSTGGIDIKSIKTDGKDEKILLSTTSSSTKVYLQNDTIYYLTSNPDTISKIDLKGKNPEVVLQRGIIDFKVVDNTIYFSDIMGYLYSVDVNGENYKTLIEEANFEEFQILDNYIYYFDDEKGKLFKRDLDKPSKKIEVTDKLNCDVYNVTSNGIYYLDKENSKIMYISSNGKKTREIVGVNTDNTKINILGNILYYIDNDKEKTITKEIKTNGKQIN